MIGKTISHYRILEKLGGGGMGVVYKAEDTKLGRTIALKVLPPERVADPNRRRRFIQEARAASALNHPNIITIYDIDEAEGVHFIAMEYVAGKTLDRLMAGHGLRVNEALKYAVQMAAALAKAHSAGIVHRDLKPTNVMVTDDGLVKVLDFGLAKLTEAVPAGEAETVATVGPVTEEGTIVGTVGYMSPEQAEGKPVDARSDIFSFGSVLYEMLTGQRAFQGETKVSTIAAILREEPKPLSQVVEGLPRELERLVKRCLRKDREHRFQTMADLKVTLEELKEESDSGELAEAVGAVPRLREGKALPYPRWAAIALAGVALVLLIGGAIGYRLFRPAPKAPAPPMRIVPFTTFPGHQDYARFSPDGNQIAFAWDGEKGDNWDIYVKLIGTEKPLRLTTDPGEDTSPSWSPDGRYIAFCRHSEHEDGIYVVPALGGAERKLHSPSLGASWHWVAGFLDWSPDGKYLAYVDRPPGQQGLSIFLLAVENPDDRRALTSRSGAFDIDSGPRFSPDGRTLALRRSLPAGASDIYTVPVAGGELKRLTFDKAWVGGLDWTPDAAYMIFSSERLGGQFRLWKVPASGGEPEALAVGQADAYEPSLSRDGHRLAYTQAFAQYSIWRYEVSSVKGRSALPTKLIASTQWEGEQQFSPDGKRIVFTSGRSGSQEIWVCDSDASNPRQLTFVGGRGAGTPRWSPDGQQIAFDASPEGHDDIYVVSAEGGRSRRLTTERSNNVTPSWSRDGKWIYFASDRTGASQTWKMPAEGGQAVQVTKKGGFAAFESLDGRTLYYAKGRDVPGLWKVPVEGGEETLVLEQLAVGLWGYWGLTAEGIYFYDASTKAIEFFSFATHKVTQIAKPEKEPVRFNVGLAVSPDGRWILYAQMDQSSSNIMLVENFRW
jgi:Tol biopolymer transport system component/predicted Ser/Thr protein kinase